MRGKNKTLEEHIEESIDFYKSTEIEDAKYLKKLIVRNLQDIKRRYVKYYKPLEVEKND